MEGIGRWKGASLDTFFFLYVKKEGSLKNIQKEELKEERDKKWFVTCWQMLA